MMKKIKNLVFGIILAVSFFVNAQEKTFQVDVFGTGEPILFFPGFTCTGEVWESAVQELSKNYQCHVFTFAGFGDVPAIEKPWLPKIKEGIQQYIQQEKLKNPSIVGHSLGGALALWLATESDSFKNLIIVDALASTGALMMPDFKSEYIVYDSPYNKQMLAMTDADFEGMVTQMANGMAADKDKQLQIKNWMLMADRETYVYGYTDLLKLDLRQDLENITVPVTILAATEPYGYEMAKSTYENQYKNLKEYELKFAEGANHFIMYDQPDWFLQNLKTALKMEAF
jgi:pimeloyl-ACP methyl ester carboxylesterase